MSLENEVVMTKNTSNGTRVFTQDELKKFYGFLDALRESGLVNMFGAAPILADTYGLTEKEARGVWSLWVDTYMDK